MGPSARFSFLKKLMPWLAPASSASEDIRTALANSLGTAENGASIAQYEMTNPAATAAAGLHAAAPSALTTPQVYLTADLVAGGIAALLAYPRNVTFTVAGGTAAEAPVLGTVVGTDIDGNALTEAIVITASAGTYAGAKAFKTITSITLTGGTGTGATVSVGFAKVFGLPAKIKARAGRLAVIQEISAGSIVTNGTFVSATTSPPYGSWSPSTNPDASVDYAVTYERDTA